MGRVRDHKRSYVGEEGGSKIVKNVLCNLWMAPNHALREHVIQTICVLNIANIWETQISLWENDENIETFFAIFENFTFIENHARAEYFIGVTGSSECEWITIFPIRRTSSYKLN